MKENITYGECLSDILNSLNIKCSRLAREINIDSSLIYKWLRSERVPSYDSPYIDLILNFLAKQIEYPFHRESIIKVITDYQIEIVEMSTSSIIDNLRYMLQASQDYSIKLNKKNRDKNKLNTARVSSVVNFADDDKVHIIKGNRDIWQATINMLRQAPAASPFNENAILLTYNSDLKFLHTSKVLHSVWIKTLHSLLCNGWKLIMHIALDYNAKKMTAMIEDMLFLLTKGSLTIYYKRKQPDDHTLKPDLCIVPETGALVSFSTDSKNQPDSAFLFRSKSSMDLLSILFYRDLNLSKPLLDSYPSQETSEFQHVFAESEIIPGDKYVFKGGLSTLTIPLSLYEKYLNLNNTQNPELINRIILHKKRLDAFENQIKHYKFKDICFIEDVVELVEMKKYPFDEKYLIQDYIPQNTDIIQHLENLITLLQNHDNYNVAFVSKARFKHLTNTYWMVKDNYCVLIGVFNERIGYFGPKMNYSIKAKPVVKAFHDYFEFLWDKIPDVNKNKENSIAWLRSLIKTCKG